VEENRVTAKKKLGFWAQVALIFFTVSGGAYGLEAMIGAIGATWTLWLTLLLPVFWAIPIALMVAELSSTLPEQGGYYAWVRRGLGSFWGFQEGWWTLCYSAADMALYPVLFVKYLSFFIPFLNATTPAALVFRWLACVAVILAALAFNLRGIHFIGRNALANLPIVALPFALLAAYGFFVGSWDRLGETIATAPRPGPSLAGIAAGLAIVLWNYCGWDNVSTYAGEVENPQRNYPRALAASLAIVVLAYVLPLLAGFKVTTSASDWTESSGWPAIAELVGGHWLGLAVALAALVSTWAMLNSQILYVSRLPAAMAEDGWLPKALAKTSEKTGAPTLALVGVSLAAALFSALALDKLMVIDILFYALGLSLEFAALIALRRKEPGLPRPFRVPLGAKGLWLMSAPPLLMATIVFVFSTQGESGGYLQAGIVCLGVAIGVALFFLRRKHAQSASARRGPLTILT
jgi:amino acid transporter